jgi:hypothetical protein
MRTPSRRPGSAQRTRRLGGVIAAIVLAAVPLAALKAAGDYKAPRTDRFRSAVHS